MKTGSIRTEEIPENFLTLMKLRRVFIQMKPRLRTWAGAIIGSLDSLFASSIRG